MHERPVDDTGSIASARPAHDTKWMRFGLVPSGTSTISCKYNVVSQLIHHDTNLVKPFTAMLMSAASFSSQLELSNQS